MSTENSGMLIVKMNNTLVRLKREKLSYENCQDLFTKKNKKYNLIENYERQKTYSQETIFMVTMLIISSLMVSLIFADIYYGDFEYTIGLIVSIFLWLACIYVSVVYILHNRKKRLERYAISNKLEKYYTILGDDLSEYCKLKRN